MAASYANNVFINCPFDDKYTPIRDAIVFAVFDCGFVPRSALEEEDSGDVRFDKIKNLISASKFGIHDISRTELDSANKLPRFNMPLELGVFIGAARFGDSKQKNKTTLILDKEGYRYQNYMSDIASQDIRSHDNDPSQAMSHVRNWLNTASGRQTIPGGAAISVWYEKFQQDLSNICTELDLAEEEVTYNDYCNFVSDWLNAQHSCANKPLWLGINVCQL